MTQLKRLRARQVLDSRGRPTLEVEAHASCGAIGLASVPSGASTGQHEAHELRDGDMAVYEGRGVLRAVAHVEGEIARALAGFDLDDQVGLDATLVALDATPRKARLGANALLGVSLAAARAAAVSRRVPIYEHLCTLYSIVSGDHVEPALPLPMINLISGGLHAGRQLDFQDFLAIPVGARSYSEALETSVRVYNSLKRVLEAHGEESRLVGDEGGFGPRLASHTTALERIVEAIERANLRPGVDVAIAIDVAASHFYHESSETYRLESEDDRALNASDMIGMLADWADRFPIVSLEDALAQDDWPGWSELTQRLGDRLQLIGDDLFCTHRTRLAEGVRKQVGNAILIKPNQVGTLSETLETMALARRDGYRAIVSARSGETEDSTLADLAVATAAGQIKVGSVVRSERLAKYNQLLRIEEALGGPGQAPFARWRPFAD